MLFCCVFLFAFLFLCCLINYTSSFLSVNSQICLFFSWSEVVRPLSTTYISLLYSNFESCIVSEISFNCLYFPGLQFGVSILLKVCSCVSLNSLNFLIMFVIDLLIPFLVFCTGNLHWRIYVKDQWSFDGIYCIGFSQCCDGTFL